MYNNDIKPTVQEEQKSAHRDSDTVQFNLKYNMDYHDPGTSFIVYKHKYDRYSIAGIQKETEINKLTNGNYRIFYNCISGTTEQNEGRIPNIRLYPTSIDIYKDGILTDSDFIHVDFF